MPEKRSYDEDYVAACRARDEAQVAMFHEVSAAARSLDDGADLEGSLESLESEYFNNMVIVLEGYFVHRERGVEGGPGTALDEVHALARSLMHNGGTLADDPRVRFEPATPVLALRAGDTISLGAADYRRLSDAYFREIERRFVADR